jgi:hypothetical protein
MMCWSRTKHSFQPHNILSSVNTVSLGIPYVINITSHQHDQSYRSDHVTKFWLHVPCQRMNTSFTPRMQMICKSRITSKLMLLMCLGDPINTHHIKTINFGICLKTLVPKINMTQKCWLNATLHVIL